MAPAHGCPRPVDPGATAAEQQVIVEPVLFARRTPAPEERGRGTLDGEHDRRIVGRRKHVAADPVRVGFPAKRVALSGDQSMIRPVPSTGNMAQVHAPARMQPRRRIARNTTSKRQAKTRTHVVPPLPQLIPRSILRRHIRIVRHLGKPKQRLAFLNVRPHDLFFPPRQVGALRMSDRSSTGLLVCAKRRRTKGRDISRRYGICRCVACSQAWGSQDVGEYDVGVGRYGVLVSQLELQSIRFMRERM